MSKPEDFKFDSRVRDRLLRKQTLSIAEVKRHLDELPDLEGEYEVMTETPQPAVAPARSEISEEPLVFEGIRRLQALSDVHAAAPAPRYQVPAVAQPVSSTPSYREPEPRTLGTPLRSALMESEISGVGAGAVSAALGAMAAEARGAAGFGMSAAISQPPIVPSVVPPTLPAEPDVPTPVTLRSEAASKVSAAEPEEDEEEEESDEDDVDDEDSDDEDEDEDEDDEEEELEASAGDVADVDADGERSLASEDSPPDSGDRV
jgi:hypothetical protein